MLRTAEKARRPSCLSPTQQSASIEHLLIRAVETVRMATAQEEFDELMRDKSRISTHPEDATDGRSFLNLSDNEDDDSPTTKREDDDADPRPSMSTYRSTIPNTRYQANTGPKGVIADAQHWRDSARTHRSAGRESSALAARTQTLSIENDAPTPPPLPTTRESDDDDLDEVDDEFMEKWRRSRLRDLQNGVWDNKSHANGQGKRLFGGLTTVDGDGYLEAVDSAGPHTVVVVYIYDDQVSTYRRRISGEC